MSPYLIVALGSAIGGALRYGMTVAGTRLLGAGWPYGTFAVNVVGSFAIGLVAGYFALKVHTSQALVLFLTTGIMGGFTTFSAFSLDAIALYERGRLELAVLYVVASVIVSLAALMFALALVRRLA
jgi:CrcB protein